MSAVAARKPRRPRCEACQFARDILADTEESHRVRCTHTPAQRDPYLAGLHWAGFCFVWVALAAQIRADAEGPRKPEMCSICRREHGAEVVHACE